MVRLKRMAGMGMAVLLLAGLAGIPSFSTAQAQKPDIPEKEEPGEKEIIPGDVLHCETLEDINRAKENGVEFIEFRNSFWVKVGEDYKGPFRYLRSAQKILNQYKLEAMKKPASAAVQGATGVRSDEPFYNPQLILFPFVEYLPNRRVAFSIPGGQMVEASQVMIHPEPLEFDNIAFGMIDLAMFAKTPPVSSKDSTQAVPLAPQALPRTSLSPPLEKYFAVTGNVSVRETVTMPTAPLVYWVGAAVVGKDGSVLWRQYGALEADRSFTCLGRMPETSIVPEYLLIFSLGKGKLEYNIRPFPQFPKLDALPYDYHIFCSSTLEMGPNWFPPLQAATKEEYDKLMEQIYRQRIDDLKKKSPPAAKKP